MNELKLQKHEMKLLDEYDGSTVKMLSGFKLMAVLDSIQARSHLESIIHEKLREGPLSVDDITSLLSSQGIAFSKSVGKEIAWKMVEEGKAHFNDKWLLELSEPTS